MNKNFWASFVPIQYVFAFLTSWFHSALLMQQTCLWQKGSPVALQHIHVPYPHPHRAWQHMDPCTIFPTHLQVWQHVGMHTHALCPLTHRHLPQQLLSPHWSLWAAILVGSQRSSRAAILVCSAFITLLGDLQQTSLFWRLTRLSFGIVCTPADLALSPFKFTQQSTRLLSCRVGKNIRRVILFQWVLLFEKPTVIVLIGNYFIGSM